jgi:TIR domain
MPSESGNPLIVISYADADEPEHPAEGEVKWLSFVTGYLKPAIKSGAVDLWLDRLMPGGLEWAVAIERQLRLCDIFILLVSSHSMSSPSTGKEIEIIRERQARGETVHFYPVVLTPTPKVLLDLLRDNNLRPRDGKPFSDFSPDERYRQMSELADEIADSAAATPTRIKEMESLETWLMAGSQEIAVVVAARAALRVAPLAIHRGRRDRKSSSKTANLTSIIFRATALAWVAAKYPIRADEFQSIALLAASAAVSAIDVGGVSGHSGAAPDRSAAAAAASAAESVAASTLSQAASERRSRPTSQGSPLTALPCSPLPMPPMKPRLFALERSLAPRAAGRQCGLISSQSSLMDRAARSICHSGRPARLDGRRRLGPNSRPRFQRDKSGVSGSTGTSSVYAAVRRGRSTNLSSPACHRRHGTKDQGRRMHEYAIVCRCGPTA